MRRRATSLLNLKSLKIPYFYLFLLEIILESVIVLSMELKYNTRFTSGFSWSNFFLIFFIVIFVSAVLDSVDEKDNVLFIANDVLGFDIKNEGKPF